MAVEASPGPDREKVELQHWEADAFTLTVEYLTRPAERRQLSAALRNVGQPQGLSVMDAFQRNARKMWRTP